MVRADDSRDEFRWAPSVPDERVEVPKVGQNGPKIAKIDIPPIHFKNCKITQNLVMEHVFWACWIQKTCLQVLGWEVGWGATWWGGKRVKNGQNHVLMEVVEKNKEN